MGHRSSSTTTAMIISPAIVPKDKSVKPFIGVLIPKGTFLLSATGQKLEKLQKKYGGRLIIAPVHDNSGTAFCIVLLCRRWHMEDIEERARKLEKNVREILGVKTERRKNGYNTLCEMLPSRVVVPHPSTRKRMSGGPVNPL